MRCSRFLLLLLIVTIVSNLTGCVAEEKRKPFELSLLIPQTKGLPPNTKVAEVLGGDILPFRMKSNPTVSEDRAFIAEFAKALFGDSPEQEKISEALYACYEENAEMGIFAFRFTEPQTLKSAAQQLPGGDRFFQVRKGNILVFIWHDGVSESAFQTFKQHVNTVLDGIGVSP